MVVIPECRASLVRDKVNDHYWEVDVLAECYSVREFTYRIRMRPEESIRHYF